MNRAKLFLLGLAVTLLGVLVCYASVTRSSFQLPVLVAILPLGILFTNRPHWLLILTICVTYSGLRVPGVAGNLELQHVLSMGFVVVAILGKMIRHDQRKIDPVLRNLVFAFLVILVIVIGARGTGFRILGDPKWGGIRYVGLLTSALLLVNIHFVHLTTRQWKWTVGLMLLLGVLPLCAEALFLLTNGKVSQHYMFFKFAGATSHNFGAFISDQTGGRLQTAKRAGECLILFVFAYLGCRRRFQRQLAAFLLVVAFGFIGVSGHRIAILRSLAFVWLFGLVYFRRTFFLYFLASAVAAVVGLIGLYLWLPSAPYSIQRTFSFLPYVDISPLAKIHSAGTIEWRLGVWKAALAEIPDHLWIGKGYTFPAGITEQLRLTGYEEFMLNWAIDTSAYHNGPLSLLIGMGLVGLVVGALLLVSTLIRHVRISNSRWGNPELHRLHVVLLIMAGVEVMVFFTIYGDVQVSFPNFFLLFALLEGIAYTRVKRGERAASAPVEIPPPSLRAVRPDLGTMCT